MQWRLHRLRCVHSPSDRLLCPCDTVASPKSPTVFLQHLLCHLSLDVLRPCSNFDLRAHRFPPSSALKVGSGGANVYTILTRHCAARRLEDSKPTSTGGRVIHSHSHVPFHRKSSWVIALGEPSEVELCVARTWPAGAPSGGGRRHRGRAADVHKVCRQRAKGRRQVVRACRRCTPNCIFSTHGWDWSSLPLLLGDAGAC